MNECAFCGHSSHCKDVCFCDCNLCICPKDKKSKNRFKEYKNLWKKLKKIELNQNRGDKKVGIWVSTYSFYEEYDPQLSQDSETVSLYSDGVLNGNFYEFDFTRGGILNKKSHYSKGILKYSENYSAKGEVMNKFTLRDDGTGLVERFWFWGLKQIDMRKETKNGKNHGVTETFRENGQTESWEYFWEGTSLERKEYFKNGNLVFHAKYREDHNRDRKTVFFKHYYENGKLRSHSMEDGPTLRFDENGSIVKEELEVKKPWWNIF